MVLWSVLAGALAATRADVGGVLAVTFAIVLATRYEAKVAIELLTLAFAAFSYRVQQLGTISSGV